MVADPPNTLTAARPHGLTPRFSDALALLALFASLLWLYGEPLALRYYAYDEGNLLLGRPIPVYAALFMLVQYGLFNGRPLSYFIWGIFLSLSATGSGLQGLRLLNLLAGLGVAGGLYLLLRQRRLTVFAAAVAVLFVYAQPVLQIYFAVALRFTYWLGIGASLLAFVLIDRSPGFLPERRRLVRAAGLLAIGWTTFQATPFCVLAPLAFAALASSPTQWQHERGRFASLVGLLVATMLVYILLYGMLLSATGARQYWLTERFFGTVTDVGAIAASGALQPGSYLGPFEWWNYIQPLPRLADAAWQRLAWLSLVFLGVSLLGAAVVDGLRGGARFATEKYGLTLVCIALTFLPLAADGFTMRQNVYIACVPTLSFCQIGAAKVLLQGRPWLRRLAFGLAAGVTIVVAIGAKAGFERALIEPSLAFLARVEQQLQAHTGPAPERLVVVVAPHECRQEPCRGVHGYRASLGNRRDLGDFYAALAARAGLPAGLPVTFTDASAPLLDTSPGTLRLDVRGDTTAPSPKKRSSSLLPAKPHE